MVIKNYLLERLSKNPQSTIFSYLDAEKVIDISMQDLMGRINALGTRLTQNKEHLPIFLLGENSVNWLLIHLTALCGAGVTAGLVKEYPASTQVPMIRNFEKGIVFYSEEYRAVALEMEKELPEFTFFCMDHPEFEVLLTEGNALINAGEHYYMDLMPQAEDLAAVQFTSGTTAGNKVVMLSQKNIAVNAKALGDRIELKSSDRSAAFLPMYHIYGCYVACYATMLAGGAVCILPNFKRLLRNLGLLKTNKIFIIPALVINILRELEQTGLTGSAATRKVFGFIPDDLLLGGAPLSAAVMHALVGFGLNPLEGYGATECTAVISANPAHAIKIGTVGRPLDGCEVKIAEDDEILVRGDTVMMGYRNDPEATDAVIYDGWFHTGDIGQLDSDGYLSIRGRKKNVIILSSGKKVFPEELEEKINRLESVEEVMVYQEGDHVIAEIYSTKSNDLVKQEVYRLNQSLSSFERIQDIRLRETPFERSSLQKIIRKRG